MSARSIWKFGSYDNVLFGLRLPLQLNEINQRIWKHVVCIFWFSAASIQSFYVFKYTHYFTSLRFFTSHFVDPRSGIWHPHGRKEDSVIKNEKFRRKKNENFEVSWVHLKISRFGTWNILGKRIKREYPSIPLLPPPVEEEWSLSFRLILYRDLQFDTRQLWVMRHRGAYTCREQGRRRSLLNSHQVMFHHDGF